MFGHSGLPRAISEGSLQSLQFLDRAAAMDDLTPDVCEEKGGPSESAVDFANEQRASAPGALLVKGRESGSPGSCGVSESAVGDGARMAIQEALVTHVDPPILGDVDVENKSNPASHALKQAVQEYHGTEPD